MFAFYAGGQADDRLYATERSEVVRRCRSLIEDEATCLCLSTMGSLWGKLNGSGRQKTGGFSKVEQVRYRFRLLVSYLQ